MKIDFFELFVNIANEEEYLNIIENSMLHSKSKKTFFYLNTFSFYLSFKNEAFRQALKNADYVIADGYSIVRAIKFLYRKTIKKVVFTYSFFPKICNILIKNEAKVFIIGGTDDELNAATQNIRNNSDKVDIVGKNNGYFLFDTETDAVIKKVNDSNANVLVVAMGMPRSEIWINEHKVKLNMDVIFSVGGFLAFVSGNKKAAPKWLYNSGFEWVFRLIQEPKRLWKRYLTANLFFLKTILTKKLYDAFR